MKTLGKLIVTAIVVAVAIPVGRYFGSRTGESVARRDISSTAYPRQPSAIERPIIVATRSTAQDFVWQPEGCEYSVSFSVKPKMSEARSVIDGTEVTLHVAERIGDRGWEKVNFLPYVRTESTTKEEAYANMTDFAKAFGMEHFDIQFNDFNPDDIVAIIKGSKTFKTQYGNATMCFLGEGHWGRRSIFTVLICAPAKDHPTKEGLACIESVRQHP